MAADINSNYYKMRSYGGWSPCIEGNNDYGLRPFPGSVLPNCVGYATGRFNEMQGLGDCIYLGSYNANYLYQIAPQQGLLTGSDPLVGACLCWDSSEFGHAVIVEEIIDANTIRISDSDYFIQSAPIVRSYNVSKVGGVWYLAPGYTFQGFIYPKTINEFLLIRHDGRLIPIALDAF